MAIESRFAACGDYAPREVVEYRGVVLPAYFAQPTQEYQVARRTAALFDRSDRAILILTGKDRSDWLHNLVTNEVKRLAAGSGCYAFAVDVRGRTQFDVNILALPDDLWLDLDAAAYEAARAHLERYLISEDVQLVDARRRFARLGCVGPRAREIAAQLGVVDFDALPALAHRALAEGAARVVRHDFAGLPGFELIAPREQAAAWWSRAVRELGVQPAGQRTLDVLRIEAGIPWLGRDIDDKVIPPETGQVERGISYRKGCYLGQEVIERMRAHGSVARRLARLSTADGSGLELPAMLRKEGQEAGRITSLVRHPREPRWIGLGYVRTKLTDLTGLTAGDPPREIAIESGAA